MLRDPEKRDHGRGGDPLGVAWAFNGGLAPVVSTSPTWWMRCSASRRRAAKISRAPRSDALVRLDLSLPKQPSVPPDAAGGYRRNSARAASGSGASGSRPVRCSTCHGQGDVTRSAILHRRYQDHTAGPTCHSHSTVIPNRA